MSVKCRNCPLRDLDIHESFNEADLKAMEQFKMGELVVDPGTPLLMEGSNSPQLFTALSGQGVRYKTLPNGRRQVINFVLPGDFLGLQAAVMSEMQHSVEATTPMVLCVFDRKTYFQFLKQYPERAYDMTWACAVEEYFLGDSLVTLGQRTAAERVAWALAKLWRRLYALDLVKGGEAPLPYRQQDLADAVGLSLVHTNKTLSRMREDGLAQWSDGKLRIGDWAGLCHLAQVPAEADVPQRPLF